MRRLLMADAPSVLVTVANTLGSTPREAGARMLVEAGRSSGTIGGGRLEHEAITAARRLIATGGVLEEMDVPLGPAIGQCCGGHVTMRLERADADVLARLEQLEQAELAGLPRDLSVRRRPCRQGDGPSPRAFAAEADLGRQPGGGVS